MTNAYRGKDSVHILHLDLITSCLNATDRGSCRLDSRDFFGLAPLVRSIPLTGGQFIREKFSLARTEHVRFAGLDTDGKSPNVVESSHDLHRTEYFGISTGIPAGYYRTTMGGLPTVRKVMFLDELRTQLVNAVQLESVSFWAQLSLTDLFRVAALQSTEHSSTDLQHGTH